MFNIWTCSFLKFYFFFINICWFKTKKQNFNVLYFTPIFQDFYQIIFCFNYSHYYNYVLQLIAQDKMDQHYYKYCKIRNEYVIGKCTFVGLLTVAILSLICHVISPSSGVCDQSISIWPVSKSNVTSS